MNVIWENGSMIQQCITFDSIFPAFCATLGFFWLFNTYRRIVVFFLSVLSVVPLPRLSQQFPIWAVGPGHSSQTEDHQQRHPTHALPGAILGAPITINWFKNSSGSSQTFENAMRDCKFLLCQLANAVPTNWNGLRSHASTSIGYHWFFLMPNRIRQCWHDVHLGMGTVLSYCAIPRLANGCIQPSVSIWFPTCGFLRVAHWPPSSAPAYSSPNGTSRAQWASWSTMVPHWPSTPELFLPWNFKQDKLPFDKSTRKYTYTCLYSHLQVHIVAEWNLEWGKITQK